MNFISHSAEMPIGSSIRYENASYGNIFLNCYIVNIILISFNYFSEYMCFVVTCWERADLLALVCGVCCEFVTFPLVSWVRCGT